MIAGIDLVDGNFYFPWIMGEFSLIFAVLYYILFVLFMNQAHLKKSLAAFRYGLILTVLIMSMLLRPYFSPYGTVTMLDIGQGDAFIIELPYRKGVVLMDAGANFMFDQPEHGEKVYTQIIKPFLYSKGIAKIDAAFLTHEDVDHIGSMDYLLEGFDVEEIFVSEYFVIPKEWKDLNLIKQVQPNDEIVIGNYTFLVLGPARDNQSINENSLVVLSRFGNMNWMFTGDIGKLTERDMMKRYPNLSVDVLKVAHHGSNTSTDPLFLHHINPEYALISVGRNNMYGHPTSEVIDVLERNEATILRTDQHGAIIFRFNQESGTFYKFLP